MADKLSLENFIQRSIKIHDGYYNYSLTNYINSYTKIKIICSIHGEFEQNPNSHLHGIGCKQCGFKKTNVLSQEEYISRVKKVHKDKYDYSKSIYKKSEEKITIICPIHGDFELRASHHLYLKQGCSKCSVDRKKCDAGDVIERFNKIHNNFYDYSLIEYTKMECKVQIICPIHGLFEQKPINHLAGFGCHSCNTSIGEKFVELFLKNNNIFFEKQKTFEGCLSLKNRKLRFDFWLPEFYTCIEYDGPQHKNAVKYWGKYSFENIQRNDEIKNQYCFNNNIGLIRIPYNRGNKNEIIQEKLFNFINKIA